jgi:aspartate/methionine/tyrosine aminotransferase
MGAVPVPIHLREARSFNFDPQELADKITAKTKLLILNSPHNPTGGIIPKAEMQAIVDVLRKHEQVWVFADEIYGRLVYDGEFVSIASFPGMQERTIISDGASKTWAMTGWRLGFAANRKLAPYFTNWVTNTESCASQISQWAGVEALNGPQDDAVRMRDIFHQRRDLIVGLLNQVPGRPVCSGDCDEHGSVSIDELVRSVNVALGSLAVADCIAADPNADASVMINELIAAVSNALLGCQ